MGVNIKQEGDGYMNFLGLVGMVYGFIVFGVVVVGGDWGFQFRWWFELQVVVEVGEIVVIEVVKVFD